MNHWTPKRINALFQLSTQMGINPKSDYAKDKILCEAFFESSTRTALSFECAMKKMGGDVIHFNPALSSKQKGESDIDSILTLTNYCDGIVLRHPDPEFFATAQKAIDRTPARNVPLIDGGSGDRAHPTQALLDLYTMYKKYGSDFKHKRILFVGDIHHSRAIHSFIQLLHHYPNVRVHLHPYDQCEPSDNYVAQIARDHCMDMDEVLIENEYLFYQDYDVIYLSRYQTERHHCEEKCDEELSLNDSDTDKEEVKSACDADIDTYQDNETYYFTAKDAACLNSDAIIMHPFPRNEELHPDVDAFPQAYYFQQMKYGVELRMGILELLFHDTHKRVEKYTTTLLLPQKKNDFMASCVIILVLSAILGGRVYYELSV